jgi:hypothetical protein
MHRPQPDSIVLSSARDCWPTRVTQKGQRTFVTEDQRQAADHPETKLLRSPHAAAPLVMRGARTTTVSVVR